MDGNGFVQRKYSETEGVVGRQNTQRSEISSCREDCNLENQKRSIVDLNLDIR
jgi:hypothetical protein